MKTLFLLAFGIILFGSCQKSNDCLQTTTTYRNVDNVWILISEHNQTLSMENNANVASNKCLNGVIYTDSTKLVVSTVCE